MNEVGAGGPLPDALVELREAVAAARLQLELPDAPAARRSRRELTAQLDDYLIPRARQRDAPLLTVVGGSTGVGKSTLVNSLVRARVSATGVLRPTTRMPVLVCHPDDTRWFADDRVLPGLSRMTGVITDHADHSRLHLVEATSVAPGLAFLDAPDVDSVVGANRELAARLLAAADLWLFVTTAARYADAVPWSLLHTGKERGTPLGIVLDRIPPDAVDEVREHLAEMLAGHGLADEPIFVVPEVVLDDGLLPDGADAAVREWLAGLAADPDRRAAVVARTFDGALDNLRRRASALADHADAQTAAVAALHEQAGSAYAAALEAVDAGISDGSLVRGEALAQWQALAGAGELVRNLESTVDRRGAGIGAAGRGRAQPGDLTAALESAVAVLVQAAADHAAEHVVEQWRARPAGAALLTDTGDDLDRCSPELPAAAAAAVRAWHDHVVDLVRDAGTAEGGTARVLSFGVAGAVLVVMLTVFASSAGLAGTEILLPGGTSALSEQLLEAVFGDPVVERLAVGARRDLHARVAVLLGVEAARFIGLLAGLADDAPAAARIRVAYKAVEEAR